MRAGSRQPYLGANPATEIPYPYHEEDYLEHSHATDVPANSVDSIGISIFQIWNLAYISRASNCASSADFPCSSNRINQSEGTKHSLRRRTFDFLRSALAGMSDAYIQGLNLGLLLAQEIA